jgi:ATP-dependent DNA ligase
VVQEPASSHSRSQSVRWAHRNGGSGQQPEHRSYQVNQRPFEACAIRVHVDNHLIRLITPKTRATDRLASMRLPQPMLAQSGQAWVLKAPGYAYEVKWDGFRTIVGLNGDLRVRRRRGWDMTELVPELASIPVQGVFDGELVAFDETGRPSWPLLCRRILHRERDIPVTFVLFDVLVHQSDNVMRLPYTERRQLTGAGGETTSGSYSA